MKLFGRKEKPSVMKLSITERMSVAIKITHEFCAAMGILKYNWTYNFRFTEYPDCERLTDVKVEMVSLPKPNSLCFRLTHCITGWKIMEDSTVILNLPEKKGQDDTFPKNLKSGENKFRISLTTHHEDNALTFTEEKD